jgi:beta-1,2-mannobiose phosphorylase / 1,2-beta-oligomannan phosphorylase
MVNVKREGIILKPTTLPFESKGVFNPACIKIGNQVHMFYRAWDKNQRSTIGYCKLDGPLKVVERNKSPIFPSKKHSINGKNLNYEDPRIVKIGKKYHLTYILFDGLNVHINHKVSNDLKTFQDLGSLSPEITYTDAEQLFQKRARELKERYFLFASHYKDRVGPAVLLWDKDAFLFPKKINGKYALVHRILPDIQIAYFKDFKDLDLNYWKKYLKNLPDHVLLQSRHWFESRNLGGGCPPIETEHGWLFIYHAVDDMDKGKTYRAGVALLDKKDPQKVIAHLHEPLFSPTEKWEKIGNVNNVVFPTGAVEFDGRLYIYYGAADKYIAAVSVDMKELLDDLLNNPMNKQLI